MSSQTILRAKAVQRGNQDAQVDEMNDGASKETHVDQQESCRGQAGPGDLHNHILASTELASHHHSASSCRHDLAEVDNNTLELQLLQDVDEEADVPLLLNEVEGIRHLTHQVLQKVKTRDLELEKEAVAQDGTTLEAGANPDDTDSASGLKRKLERVHQLEIVLRRLDLAMENAQFALQQISLK